MTQITLLWSEWEAAKRLADQRMKAKNGHSYVISLKTRCQWCGRSPRNTRRCGQWFRTLFTELDRVLLNLDRERESGELQ